MKYKKWALFVIVAVSLLLVAGCVPSGEVDVTKTDPSGPWQSIVVWPMAKSLIWIDSTLVDMNVNYHWGFAIILFTVAVKVLTFPLTLTQVRGMQAQKEIQPKIQELQKKYGKDRERMAQEQMKLYKEAGVNPLSGCLPLIVQMPILFGLYSALIVLSDRLENQPFYWLPDLGFPAYTGGLSWISEDFSNGDYGHLAAYLVLPLLLMASQFVVQKFMTPATPSTGNDAANMTKQMGTIMTLMFGFFTLQVPAGLSLYWVTSNLLQMVTQWMIMGDQLGLPKIGPASLSAGTPVTIESTATPVDSSSNGSEVESSANGTSPTTTPKAKAKPNRSRKSGRRRAKRKK